MPSSSFPGTMAYPGVGVRFYAPGIITKITRIRGHFSTLNTDANDAHRAMAYKVKLETRKALEEAIRAHGRKQRPGRKLPEAITHEENELQWYTSGANAGFSVNRPDWFNSSRSGVKDYWWIQEYGTDVFVGRPIYAFPGGSPNVAIRDPKNWSKRPFAIFRSDGGEIIKGYMTPYGVRNRIKGYRYLLEGRRRGAAWLRAGGARRAYEDHLPEPLVAALRASPGR